MTAKKSETTAEIRFGEAIEELEGILHRVEAEEIDIDDLAEELKKAAELLEVCRSKIRQAELEVTQIVQALDEDDPVGADLSADKDEE
jgi:exodeoxyribonuclease VII small subunit